ncbi:CLUMA_CG004030, isoform A [Clunio marinus]|uniref:CLUMA_CG004030, isoform A n=1 Tax=Clunio marinus TaxID=568069 RepID=A0A1J1HQR8_9DIPT|nr:CLUMA_CG004030, isoform A [Clunio marinus]
MLESHPRETFSERSSSSVRDRYSNDPAFTDDIRHLALPTRRNSGPESEALKMFGKKKSKSNSKEEYSSHYSLRLERRKKSTQANNYSAEYLCKNSSSSESLDNIISSYKLKGRKGCSLDRNIQSFDVEQKPQSKPKRSSWFLRSREKKSEKFLKRSSLDFTVTYDTKQVEKPRSKAKTIQRQNAADYTGDSSTTTPQEEIQEPKKSVLSKFQIGKRFLKGEIGIRSFNYYLLKEGLKKNQSKQKQDSNTTKPRLKSKSEENIYEEIYFYQDQPTPKPRTPPALPPFNKQSSMPLIKPKKPLSDDGNCMSCEICLQEAQQGQNQQQQPHTLCDKLNCDKCVESRKLMTGSLSGSEGYAQVQSKLDKQSIYDFFQQQQQQSQKQHSQNVLQFQSYNPNNPNVYKIETTPVAFEYMPIEEQIYQLELNQLFARAQQQQTFKGDGKVMPKSSSSSDSIRGPNQLNYRQPHQQQSNEFYTRPNYLYSNDDKQGNKDQNSSSILYKTDSSNSIRSENSLNKIYNSKNSSQKSNQSNKSRNSNNNHNRDETLIRQDMSDSSLDFDDTNINNMNNINNNRMMKSHHNGNQQSNDYQAQQIFDQKSNRYAEDFIKHVSNVKRRSQNTTNEGNNVLINNTQQLITSASIYEVPRRNPKRLEADSLRSENDEIKLNVESFSDDLIIKESDKMLMQNENQKTNQTTKPTGTVPKLSSSISSNDSKKKKKTDQKLEKESKQNDVDADENLVKGKAPQADESFSTDKKILSHETLSSEVKVTDMPMNDNNKTFPDDSLSKIEQLKNVAVYDDDDDVFLEDSKCKDESATQRDNNENKTVSTHALMSLLSTNINSGIS